MRDTNARTDGIRNLIQARLRFHISRSNIMLRHSAWRRGATVHQLRSPIGHHCAVRHPADSPPENAPCRRPFIQPSSSSAPAWPPPRSSSRSLPASPTATTSAYSARQSDRAVVIGGGLLGLEAARGLLSYDIQVTVVEVAPHLMIQQLDPLGGALLKRTLEGLGVEVLLEKATAALLGDGRVTGLRFKDGSTLDADMVVISCGIRPNIEEAKAAGLKVEKGIVVDDRLRTSDPSIFAVGECVQHKSRLYGLVDPLSEQARVLADCLTGAKPQAAYEGSRLGTGLKGMGVELAAMGGG